MRINDHPVYRDLSHVLNTRGLRELRRQLRRCDRIIVEEAKKRGSSLIPVNVRMQMVYESELDAQEQRRKIINAPIKVTTDGNRLIIDVSN